MVNCTSWYIRTDFHWHFLGSPPVPSLVVGGLCCLSCDSLRRLPLSYTCILSCAVEFVLSNFCFLFPSATKDSTKVSTRNNYHKTSNGEAVRSRQPKPHPPPQPPASSTAQGALWRICQKADLYHNFHWYYVLLFSHCFSFIFNQSNVYM